MFRSLRGSSLKTINKDTLRQVSPDTSSGSLYMSGNGAPQIWHHLPRTSGSSPLRITRAEAYLYTEDGRRIIDRHLFLVG